MKTHFLVPRSTASWPTTALLIFILCVFSVASLKAQTHSTWKGGTGNWSNGADWNNGVPNGNYNALISNGGPVST